MADAATYIPKGRALVIELAILLCCNFLGGFSESMMNIALVRVSDFYDIRLSVANYSVVAFTIVAATAITVSAAALERFGLRRVTFFALGTTVAGCVIGWFASNFAMVVIARMLQAFSVGVFFPVVTAVIMSVVDASKRGVVISINSAIIGLGIMCGPSVSGLMLDALDVRGVFVLPGAFAALVLIAAVIWLKDIYARRARKVDFVSIVMSFVGMACLMYGLSEVTQTPLPAAVVLAVGVVILALFIARQLQIAMPLLNLSTLKHKVFSLGVTLTLLIMMINSSVSLLLPLFYEGACEFSSGTAGLLMVAPLAVYALMDVVSGFISDRRGVWPIVICGCILMALGALALFVFAGLKIAWVMVACAVVLFCGVGFAYPPTKVAELAALPREVVSSGSAINSCIIQVANSIGQALFVGVMSADVVRMTGEGIAKAAAYSNAFSHTLIISLGIVAVCVAVGVVFTRVVIKAQKDNR